MELQKNGVADGVRAEKLIVIKFNQLLVGFATKLNKNCKDK